MNQIDEEIELVPPNVEWKADYQNEATEIKNRLGYQIIDIQHIGSTSIPNIYSKPIIDIMVGIYDLINSGDMLTGLVDLGYEYLGEANVTGRLYLRKRNSKSFNIALCQYKGEIWNNNILFRDYLISHPAKAKEYSECKQAAYSSGAKMLLEYSRAKHSIVERILKEAKLEKADKQEH